MSRLRTAVVGCGHFGRFHAQKHARSAKADLIYLCDPDPERARMVALETGGEAVVDPSFLIGRIDAVSVAAPTEHHYAVAAPFLQAGVHCLIEKPIAATVEEGEELLAIARRSGAVVQVGHLERFNPAFRAMEAKLTDPVFIECHRLSPFRRRALDVSVILDLMIHDIDLILSVARSELLQVDACGVDVLSERDDIANVRLRFASGCVANLTASRISFEGQRKMRIFQRSNYISIDFGNRTAMLAKRAEATDCAPTASDFAIENASFEPVDQLAVQTEAFFDAALGAGAPPVDGEAGLAALRCAMRIVSALDRPDGAG